MNFEVTKQLILQNAQLNERNTALMAQNGYLQQQLALSQAQAMLANSLASEHQLNAIATESMERALKEASNELGAGSTLSAGGMFAKAPVSTTDQQSQPTSSLSA